jgi:excisionase family DNA binding protein
VTETLSIAQVAEVLGVSRDSVERMIKRGDLPAFHVGYLVKIAKRDVVALRKDRRWVAPLDHGRGKLEAKDE